MYETKDKKILKRHNFLIAKYNRDTTSIGSQIWLLRAAGTV